MVTVEEKIKSIKKCLGPVKLSSNSKNVSALCPVCISKGKVTSKKKLSISIETGIYHCWVCESKGHNIGRLCIEYKSGRPTDRKDLYSIYRAKKEKEVIEEVVVPELPEDFTLVYSMKKHKLFSKHYQYLLNRGFDEKKMKQFRIGVSDLYEYKNRVIFPSFDKDLDLNYFVSRSIDPEEKFRYKNFKGSKKDLIFRECDLDFNKELILTEGVFDLVNCPNNSTCVLGSWLSEEYLLFRKIVQNKTPVTICFDPDAKDKAHKIAENLSNFCVSVKLTDHSDKDFGDMSKKEVDYYLETAKLYDNALRMSYLLSGINSGSIF